MPAVNRQIKGYCAVSGIYARPDGAPVVGALVLVEPLKVEPLHAGRVQSPAPFNVTTDENGRFLLPLAPGRYRIAFGRDGKFIINVPDQPAAHMNDLVEGGS